MVRALRGEFDGFEGYMYVIRFRMPYTEKMLYKIGSGSGNRKKALIGVLRRAGAENISDKVYDYPNAGEAIVVEHLAHEQLRDSQHVVPENYKFAGHTEVFTKFPDIENLEAHPVLLLFRAGERWDPRA